MIQFQSNSKLYIFILKLSTIFPSSIRKKNLQPPVKVVIVDIMTNENNSNTFYFKT